MKLFPFSSPLIALAIAGMANAQVETPGIGYVRYGDGSIHAVYGLPGNYIVGKSLFSSVDLASFSRGGALLTTAGSLHLLDTKLAAVASIAISNAVTLIHLDDDPTSAIGWVQDSQALVHWDGRSFQTTTVSDLPTEGKVVSVRKLGPAKASLLIVMADGTASRSTVSLETGSLLGSSPLAGMWGMVYEDESRILRLVKHKLAIVSVSGETLKVFSTPMEDDVVVEYASAGCLHLSSKTTGRDWLLHTVGNDNQLFQLPQPRKQDPKPELTSAETPK